MVIRVYVSGISGNKEVKKRQQRVLMILESKNIPCDIIDITEPGRESDKEFMQQNSKPRGDQKHPLPPQIFNDDEYCGDYDDFDMANEVSELEIFLKGDGRGSTAPILSKEGSDFVGFDLANENEVLLPFLKMAVPEPEEPPMESEEESDDESNQKPEPEPEHEPSRPRPRPRPVSKPEPVEEPVENGDDSNLEDTSGNGLGNGGNSEEDARRPEGNNEDAPVEEEDMATQDSEDGGENSGERENEKENTEDSEQQGDAQMDASEE